MISSGFHCVRGFLDVANRLMSLGAILKRNEGVLRL